MSITTDWIQHLSLIEDKENKTILELGCGVGTKTLVQTFKKVYSFETFKDDSWFKKTTSELKEFNNWETTFNPFSYYGFDKSEGELLKSGGKTRNQKPLEKYLSALEDWIDLSIIDVAFVDQGFHLRGETINYFMEKSIPIIFAHDTNQAPKLYGWNLPTPESFGYKVEGPSKGQGTTFYFK